MNVDLFDLRKDGAIGFSHPNGTHDDVFWATSLAVYGTCEMSPEPFLAVVPRIACLSEIIRKRSTRKSVVKLSMANP